MVGVFFAVAPIWGFQMLAIIGICFLFNLNKPLALLVAQISIPPAIPFILYVSYEIGGNVISSFSSYPVQSLSLDIEITFATIRQGYFQYATGAIVLGVMLASVVGMVGYTILKNVREEPED